MAEILIKSICIKLATKMLRYTYLSRVDTIRDLGILIDEQLSFKEHIHDKFNKAYRMLGLIKRNFKYLTTESFTLLYKNMVRSQLDYCIAQYGPRIEKAILKLLKRCKRKP